MVPVAPAARLHSEPPPPSSEEVLAQLQRVLASSLVRESRQLQAFLDFVVRETLAGGQDGLKEYLIGCRVFGRKPDYDPRHDGIVRVQATTLRKRLEKYYAGDGAADPIVIEVPRGGYVAVFRHARTTAELAVDPPAVLESLAPIQAEPARSGTRVLGRSHLFAFILGIGVAVGLLLGSGWLHRSGLNTAFTLTRATPEDFPQLWAPFFASKAHNLVAYGVPLFFERDGLYVRDVQVNVAEGADQGRIKEFARKFDVSLIPRDDIYTGVGELASTHQLSNFFTTHGIPVEVRSARSFGRSNLAGKNLLVISSLRFQTLLGDLHLPSDFEFVPKMPETIRNHRPLAGEQSEYVFGTGAGVSTSYAMISVWPGEEPEHRIVHVGGVHTWATEAAAEFLLDPAQLQKLAQTFAGDKSRGARGAVSPYFQIILRVEGRENHSLKAEYVTHHYLPQAVGRNGS